MVSNNNQYFETPNRIEGELTDDVIVNRMQECNIVLKELADSVVWKIVINDSRGLIKMLDDKWEDMLPDSKEFREARILKMACKHISELPRKYENELKQLQEELTKRQNPDEIISKDNDNG